MAASLGLPVHRARWEWPSLRRALPFAALASSLARQLGASDAQLVHVNSPVEAAPFVLASRLAGLPCVVHVRIAYPRRFLRRQFLPLAEAVVFNSAALREECGWAAGTVVHNGVALPEPLPTGRRRSLREEGGAGDDDLLLGVVGQLIPEKGVDVAIDAFAQLAPAHPGLRLVVVGRDHQREGRYQSQLEERAATAGVADRVRFLGFREDAPDIIAALDLLWVPSRREPFGRVVAEAMAAAVPVVASRVGGIPELLGEGAGELVPAGEPGALAAATVPLLADPARRAACGARGRARVEQHFSEGVHAARMRAIYDRALSAWGKGA